MEDFRTIERESDASSAAQEPQFSVTGTSASNPWSTTSDDREQSGDVQPSASTSGPKIVIESAAGHQLVLTYEDIVLMMLVGTLAVGAVSAWRGR